MRRIVSLLMAIVMMASFSTSAFATSSNINVDPNEDTVTFLDMHHISREKLVSIATDDASEQTYIYQLTDTVRAEIMVEEREHSKFLTIREGNLVNTLEITDEGRYILNGNVVTVSGNDILPDQSIAVPCYPVDTYYTDDCPYGKASDYTKFVKSDAVANISFGTAFANITLTAFTAIIGKFIDPILGLGTSIAVAILTSFQEYDPHSEYASYKENQYVHKTKGSFVTIEKSVLMYDMELWPQADYKGTSVNKIAYKVTLWENGEG